MTNAKGEPTMIVRIDETEGEIINAVTASGWIITNGLVAASNPFWVSQYTIGSPIMRFFANVGVYLADIAGFV